MIVVWGELLVVYLSLCGGNGINVILMLKNTEKS